MGIQLPQRKGAQRPPTFAISIYELTMVDIYCGQTAGMIRMPFGTEVGLGPGDIVLDGDPALPTERAQRPPLFGHVYYDQTVAHLSNCRDLVKGVYSLTRSNVRR